MAADLQEAVHALRAVAPAAKASTTALESLLFLNDGYIKVRGHVPLHLHAPPRARVAVLDLLHGPALALLAWPGSLCSGMQVRVSYPASQSEPVLLCRPST